MYTTSGFGGKRRGEKGKWGVEKKGTVKISCLRDRERAKETEIEEKKCLGGKVLDGPYSSPPQKKFTVGEESEKCQEQKMEGYF